MGEGSPEPGQDAFDPHEIRKGLQPQPSGDLAKLADAINQALLFIEMLAYKGWNDLVTPDDVRHIIEGSKRQRTLIADLIPDQDAEPL